ncbi:MAG TPA: HD domain-containing phosphohydrolase [Blastocatellia bacterium]|nr:HD domain-containing phosphohydrolase [Blastocatellia bacterium]
METAKGKTHEEINRLANRIDTFEKYNYPHARLIAELATRLARRLGLTPQDTHALTEAALLHDIGLQAMMPPYHTTPGLLSYEERMDLWRHAVIGEQQMAKRDATRHAQLLVRWHHEWWCGLGYPDMLAYEDIPIGARLLRAVELYCALIGDRPYRAAMSAEQAMETLKASAGIECDPYVIKALAALVDDIRAQAAPATAPAPTEGEPAATASSLASPLEPATPTSSGELSAVPVSPIDAAPDESNADSHLHAPTHEATHKATDWQATRSNAAAESLPSFAKAEAEQTPLEPSRDTATADYGTTADAPSQAHASGIAGQADAITHDEPHAVEPPADASDAHEPSGEEPARPDSLSHEGRTPSPVAERTAVEGLMSDGRLREFNDEQVAKWCGWRSSSYNRKSLLGFEASVLRQVEFRSIAIPFFGWTRLDLYLKAWGKLILANDPRAWAAAVARAMLESRSALGEEQIARVLEDVYVPGARLTNPDLRRWFGETDAWWMDNLRRNIESLDDESCRAQALAVGLMTGDYTLSFTDETRELRRPLTTIFWRLAGRALTAPAGHVPGRSSNLPAEEFIRQARADLLYLNLPVAHTTQAGSEARAAWREAWVRGPAAAAAHDIERLTTAPQSKHAYLAMIDRLLRAASHLRTWAISYQEIGLTTAAEITELIQEHRPVRATYSKDLTEVAGGLRNYIIVADRAASK